MGQKRVFKGFTPGCDVLTPDKRIGMVRALYADTGRILVQFGVDGPFEEFAPGRLTVVKNYEYGLAKVCPWCGDG